MNYFNQLEIEKEEEEVLKQQIMERFQSMMGGNLYVRQQQEIQRKRIEESQYNEESILDNVKDTKVLDVFNNIEQ